MKHISQLHLHVGAHKTATQHVQDTLSMGRKVLFERGVDYLPRDEVRRVKLPPGAGLWRWRVRLGWPMRRRFEATLAPLRRGPERVLISEEDLLGWSTELLAWPFYPRAEQRLQCFASFAGRTELKVFLSVRNFAKLLPSAYAQVLRWRPVPGGFEVIRAAALRRPPSWTDLILRIRRVLPTAQILVWTVEDYSTRSREILAEFCGTEIPNLPELPPPRRTRSPSAQAISAIEALNSGLGEGTGSDYSKAVRSIIDEDRGKEKFVPFSDGDAAFLTEAYQDDLARLSRICDLITFSGGR